MVPWIELPGIRLPTHELFTLIGLIAGVAIYYAALRREGLLEPTVITVSIAVLAGGAIGARVLLAWDHLDELRALEGLPLVALVERSGKSLLGAIAGGYLAGLAAKRLLHYRRSTGDCYAIALPVGIAIGRIGCFLTELPLGAPTGLPWGVRVSPEAAARFASCAGCDGPMHPVMLYEIGFNAIAIAVLLWMGPRIPVRGDRLKVYLLAALTFRFLTEPLRAEDIEALGLTAPQLVLLPMLALLLLHFGREWRRGAWQVPVPPRGPALARSAAGLPAAARPATHRAHPHRR